MPAINCPIPGCDFTTEDVDAILAAAQLNIHSLVRQQGGNGPAGPSKQNPPKIVRPTVLRGSTDEE